MNKGRTKLAGHTTLVGAEPEGQGRKGVPSLQPAPAGQIMPHWLLCSWRGLAILPSRPIGELMRRRWLSVDA